MENGKRIEPERIHDKFDIDPNEIADSLQDPDKMFAIIEELSKKALVMAAKELDKVRIYRSSDIETFLSSRHYKFKDMLIVTVYHIIYHLIRDVSSSAKAAITNKYDEYENNLQYDSYDTNKKRVGVIDKMNKDRNEDHLKFFNITEKYVTKMFECDSSYYKMLSSNKVVEKFLYERDALVNIKLIRQLQQAYEYMDSYDGYNAFMLNYRFEMDCKIDLFTHMINILLNSYNKKKITFDEVTDQVEYMAGLHSYYILVANSYRQFFIRCIKNPECDILLLPYFGLLYEIFEQGDRERKDINKIVFGYKDIYKAYENGDITITKIINDIIDLNLLLGVAYMSVVYAISSALRSMWIYKITQNNNGKEPPILDNDKFVKAVKNDILNISTCHACSDFFDNVLHEMKDEIDFRLICRDTSQRNIAKCLNHLYIRQD